LDLGTRYIGLSVSDDNFNAALPLEPLSRLNGLKAIEAKQHLRTLMSGESWDKANIDKDFERKNGSTFISDEHLIYQLSKLIYRYNVFGLVIGMPLNLRNELDSLHNYAVEFAAQLHNQLKVNFPQRDLSPLWQDERFTTVTARKRLKEVGIKRSEIGEKIYRTMIDSMAAQIILQDFIKHMRLIIQQEEHNLNLSHRNLPR